jgi:phytoene dehydrogenase-like protein
VVTWSSRQRTRAQLARDWSAADADAYASWAERWDAAAARARPLLLEPPDRERWLAAVGPGILDGSIAGELAEIPSEEVRVPFALQGLIGALAGPQDPGTAFVAFFHGLGDATEPPGAWGFARGGMGAVTGALRAAAEAAGARVRTEAPVERVLRDGDGHGDEATGAAAGVVLEGGEEVRARAVLSNADPLRTAALAGAPAPAGWRQAGPVVKVMLLLDGLPDFPAWPGPGRGPARSTSASRWPTWPPPPTTRAPGGPPRGRGSRRPARRPPTRRWHRPAATSCRSSASATRPT